MQMSFKDDKQFRKQLERSSNPYTSVAQVAQEARELAASYSYDILFSEAITHVIHGTTPVEDDYSYDKYEDYQIREMFCLVDDIDVRNAVYDSYFESKKQGHLIYIYNNIDDNGRQTRVRVLTRMLWYTCVADT